MNLIIFLSSYFIIIISLVGYSVFFQNISKKKIDLEFEFCLLSSIFIWIIISLFTHFFFSHNFFHNGIILALGLIFFLVNIKKNFIH